MHKSFDATGIDTPLLKHAN